MVQAPWPSTNIYYSNDMRRKPIMPAGAADRIMYSCKLGSTEKFKKWILSMAESLFRAEQRRRCTAHLLAGIPCTAEAAHSFRWDAVMRSQAGWDGKLKAWFHIKCSKPEIEKRKFLFPCTNAPVGPGNLLLQDVEVSSSRGFPNGLEICKQQTSPGNRKD